MDRSAPLISKLLVVLTFIATSVFIAGCGGGGSGGGGGGGPAPGGGFLTITGTVFYGFATGAGANRNPFPTTPPLGVPLPAAAPPGSGSVSGAEFGLGNPGEQTFIELTFNVPLDATTIFPGSGAATDGIVIFLNTIVGGAPQSTPVSFVLDAAGVLNAQNEFPTPTVAPATLRLYYDTDNNITTPERLPEGSYTLRVTGALRASGGGLFCTGPSGTGCNGADGYLPELSFNVGNDTTPLAMRGGGSGVGASNITQGDTSVPRNSEIHLNFSKSVDFPSLVGAANLTSRDPFITIPFGLAAGACATAPVFGANIGNLFVGYNAPTNPGTGTPESLPIGLGVVVYMPDPILAPNHVRVRFVDARPAPAGTTPGTSAELSGLENLNPGAGPVTYQNYASNPTRLPIASNAPGQAVVLPIPDLEVVPGSTNGYSPALGATDPRAAIVDLMISGPAFGNPSGIVCAALPGGVFDRVSMPAANAFVFNQVQADYWLRFIFAESPAQSKNPHPPDAVFVGTQNGTPGISVINTAQTMSEIGGVTTGTWAPSWAGAQPIGTVLQQPEPLSDPGMQPIDLEIGHWILTQTTQTPTQNNSIANPGRGVTAIPGTPDTQNSTTPDGLLGVLGVQPSPFPPLQPMGNFLYVADGTQNIVRILNGYDYSQIGIINGVGSPGGLAISPDLEFLYVTNSLGAQLIRVYANPVGPLFHQIAQVIAVGSAPGAVSVQPGNEDAIVCNFGENSISIVDVNAGQEVDRLALQGGIGPSEVLITNRMTPGTAAYMAFVLNRFSDNVSVYESDSPLVPENGTYGVIKATIGGFNGPRRGCWNLITFIGLTTEPGAFIANTQGDRVEELTLTNFTLSTPPPLPGPVGTRTFRILKTYPSLGPLAGAAPSDVSIDTSSGLYNVLAFGVNNNKSMADPSVGGGTPTFVLVSYPSAGLVAVWDHGAPVLRSTANVPGCDFMQSYYDQ